MGNLGKFKANFIKSKDICTTKSREKASFRYPYDYIFSGDSSGQNQRREWPKLKNILTILKIDIIVFCLIDNMKVRIFPCFMRLSNETLWVTHLSLLRRNSYSVYVITKKFTRILSLLSRKCKILSKSCLYDSYFSKWSWALV